MINDDFEIFIWPIRLEKKFDQHIQMNFSKQEPKWGYLVGKNIKLSQKQFFFNNSNKCFKIMFFLISAVELVRVKIWCAHLKALEDEDAKIILGLPVGQILPEKIKKMLFLNFLGFLDV